MPISKKKLAISAVLALIVIVIIVAALGGNADANDGGNGDTPEVRTAQNSKMRITVTDMLIGDSTNAPGLDTFFPLDEGKHFVVAKFDLTNKMSTSNSAPGLFWKLYTSDGQISTISFHASNVIPDGIQGGATASFIIPFEVADGATPTKLVYDGLIYPDLEIAL